MIAIAIVAFAIGATISIAIAAVIWRRWADPFAEDYSTRERDTSRAR